MAEFAYNNAKNASTSYTPFELNCNYYLWISYKKEADLYSKSKSVDKLLVDLIELMSIYQKTSTMLKNFKSRPTIKALSLEAMFLMTKYD